MDDSGDNNMKKIRHLDFEGNVPREIREQLLPLYAREPEALRLWEQRRNAAASSDR